MRKGFTLAEIVIAIAILVVVGTVMLASIREYTKEQALSGAVSSVAAVLSDARLRTLSGNAGVQYGVHLQSDAVVLFSGATYTESDPNNEVIELDTRVMIADISLSGGGEDIVFEKLSGDTDNFGTVTLALSSDASRQRTITVQGTGLVSIE
ncbi:MAG: hypothetical protein AMXMBFR44_0590 [Candidatus Campbellbacteria bacterium]